MTILDDLFSEAEGLWNSIQGTADNTQQVVVDAAMVRIPGSDLKASLDQPDVLPSDTLAYTAGRRALNIPATFAGLTLSIMGPNLHIVPVQPNYQVQLDTFSFVPTAFDSLYFYVNIALGWGRWARSCRSHPGQSQIRGSLAVSRKVSFTPPAPATMS
jgi:hypothetical protein